MCTCVHALVCVCVWTAAINKRKQRSAEDSYNIFNNFRWFIAFVKSCIRVENFDVGEPRRCWVPVGCKVLQRKVRWFREVLIYGILITRCDYQNLCSTEIPHLPFPLDFSQIWPMQSRSITNTHGLCIAERCKLHVLVRNEVINITLIHSLPNYLKVCVLKLNGCM